MKKFIPIEYIELFHLHFLEQLSLKTDRKLYAIKGGCNLRFFLKSIRYSQDMDIDVKIIQKETLAKRVRKILASENTKRFLQAHKIIIGRFSEPKQTQTTQRWKISLQIRESSTPLNTKIEFSRRGIKEETILETVDSLILSKYQLNPIFASHYTAESAYMQKLCALIGRSKTQARDVFDLFHLINLGIRKPKISLEEADKAKRQALSLTYKEFKGQVLAYLPFEYHSQYEDPSFWEKIILRVVEEISNEAH